jgi:hypothetical protein
MFSGTNVDKKKANNSKFSVVVINRIPNVRNDSINNRLRSRVATKFGIKE